MGKQIRKLSLVQLRNLFGFNEIRYTKDKSKKKRYGGVAVAAAVLILMALFYVTMMCFGLAGMGLAQLIPGYLFAISSVAVLIFSIFKAGSVIFQKNSYEMLVSLPVSNAAIVISRFVTMYVTNLLFGMLIMLPGVLVYAIFVRPGISFYLYSILGIALMPLLPLTIATALGAGVTALTARMKHKSIVSAVASLLFCLAIVLGSFFLSGSNTQMSEAMMRNLAETMDRKISQMYYPAAWYTEAAVSGSFVDFLLLVAVSVGLFVLLIAVLQKNFLSICTALNATSAKNDYKMQKLARSSKLSALCKKEAKRYFASSAYVTNTMFSPVFMVILALALFFVGPQKVESLMQMPGVIMRAMPFVLAAMMAMMPISACSVSMEGKEWWRLMTLPVRKKDIVNAKLLFPVLLVLPFYVGAEFFTILALKPSVMEAVWILVIPALYLLFLDVLGLAINFAMPVFEWENEVRIVKNSASVTITLFAGMFAAGIPLIMSIMMKGSEELICVVTALILVVAVVGIYVAQICSRKGR